MSDTWRFIYIRQPKASSSSMLQAIRSQLCGGTCRPPFFYQEHTKALFEAKWESYFVFTIVRNPWTRALSAYSMFNRGVLFKCDPLTLIMKSHHAEKKKGRCVPYDMPSAVQWYGSHLISLRAYFAASCCSAHRVSELSVPFPCASWS